MKRGIIYFDNGQKLRVNFEMQELYFDKEIFQIFH